MTWRECTLGDVMKLQRGHDLPDRLRIDGQVPVVSSSGITGHHNIPKAEPPGVVTGRYGTIGEVFFLEQPYWPLNTALYVVDFKGNHPRFLAYLLKNTLRNYRSEKAAVPGVDRNVLHLLRVRAPDRSIQEIVVSILSAYDDLIETNKQQIALLETAAQLIYRDWFVQFRYPGHEHVKLVNGLPSGWERHTLGELAADISYGFTESASHDIEGPKFLRITDIASGPIDWSSVPRCPISEEKLAKFLLCSGDIVVARTGATTGWARRIGRQSEPAVFASYLVRFRFSGKYRPELAAIFMESEAYKAFVKGNLGGAAQPNASAKVLARAPVPVPPSALQLHFAETVSSMFEQVDVLMEQNQKLAQARDLLLPRLMNGKIVV